MPRIVLTDENRRLGQIQCKIFAERFRAARIMSGKTQRDIARMTGITQRILSSVENGTQNITIHTAAMLAHAVGVPLFRLFVPVSDRAYDETTAPVPSKTRHGGKEVP